MKRLYKRGEGSKHGVYFIRNSINNKIYIGSTSRTFSYRLKLHRRHLRKGIHCNVHLQNAFDKYGTESFEYGIIEIVIDNSIIVEREQYWMNHYKSFDKERGYNILRIAYSSLGYKHTEKSKLKMSLSRKGKKQHPNTHKAILRANTGKKHTPERILKVSISQRGKIISKETRRRLSISLTGLRYGRKIIQLDNDLKILKIFGGQEDCSKELNISKSQIRTICNGRSIQRKEYILMYEYYPIKSGRTNRRVELKWRK